MGKISKSDQDPHQTDHDRTALEEFLSKKSQHFAVGSWVVYEGERWQVNDYFGRAVILTRKNETGVEIAHVFNPYFTQWGV